MYMLKCTMPPSNALLPCAALCYALLCSTLHYTILYVTIRCHIHVLYYTHRV